MSLTREQRMYDQWRTASPPWYDEPEPWEWQRHCPVCGCWLKLEPTRWKELTEKATCDGPDPEYGWTYCEEGPSLQTRGCPGKTHEFTLYGGTEMEWDCTRCGATTTDVEM